VNSPNEPIEIGDDPTALYRLYGKDDGLLYVGITRAPGPRLAQHASTQPWWPEVARKTMVWYPTRADASEAEDIAVAGEKPKHNIVMSTNPDQRRRWRHPQRRRYQLLPGGCSTVF
jgi:predicted GIY-YIG superfamily endonuclease